MNRIVRYALLTVALGLGLQAGGAAAADKQVVVYSSEEMIEFMAQKGDVTLSSGDCALPTALGNQATAPVTAFQCAIARMRWMWVARAERL